MDVLRATSMDCSITINLKNTKVKRNSRESGKPITITVDGKL